MLPSDFVLAARVAAYDLALSGAAALVLAAVATTVFVGWRIYAAIGRLESESRANGMVSAVRRRGANIVV